jgi:hypothetical protein
MLAVRADATWRGQPAEVLAELLRRRQRDLGESCEDAVAATAIDVVNSLRAATRKAPEKANKAAYILEETPYVASWERVGSRYRRVARVGGTGSKAPIYPANRAGRRYLKGERVKVWKITPAHGERMDWKRNRNKECWYVFAQSAGEAARYAAERMTRVLAKESGMGKTALGYAMARLSTRSPAVEAKGSKAKKLAADAIVVKATGDGRTFRIEFRDDLEYAKFALKGGPSTVDLAMKKAANKIAGRLSKWAESHMFAEKVPTPFPEVLTRRRS